MAMIRNLRPILMGCLSISVLMGCADETPEQRSVLTVKAYVSVELDLLHRAALDLQAAAPDPDVDGWNAEDDAAAVEAMRRAWREARTHYERIEGAIAVLFPGLDASTDERYDGFLEEGPDSDLFDAEGVIGVHAIERILWADSVPDHVLAFESGLSGYTPAAFPATAAEATRFRDALCQRLVDDTDTMRTTFEPLALDPASAFRGVIGSMAEQVEKTSLAATGEDESRYAAHTLGDMRANLEGGLAIYEAFGPGVIVEGGGATNDGVHAGFDRVRAIYEGYTGSALPPVPEGWNPDAPSDEHLATEYGMLFAALSREADPDVADSLVSHMRAAAELLGIRTF